VRTTSSPRSVRRRRQPALSRPSPRARHHAGRGPRSAAPLCALLIRLPYALTAESRPVPSRGEGGRLRFAVARGAPSLHAPARPLGGRLPQYCPVHPGNLHGLGRVPVASVRALLSKPTTWKPGRQDAINGQSFAEYHEAQLVVQVEVWEILVNCPRYVHKATRAERSPFVPTRGCETPIPDWKHRTWCPTRCPRVIGRTSRATSRSDGAALPW
jgi:hypothetical protein